MSQIGYYWNGSAMTSFEFPDEKREVIPGVKWGSISAFPSPAYWKYQVLARREEGSQIKYRLGNTLTEEIGACLLGGHGIPASVGIAAFTHLKSLGAFELNEVNEELLLEWLSAPITHGGKTIKYRFARQKSRYLYAALTAVKDISVPQSSGNDLRNWLLALPGIGYKTASWIARNWLDADDVAILDIHILRAGQLGGFFSQGLTVEKHYLEIEKQFLEFSRGLGIRASELDAVIWHEMMLSPRTIHRMLQDNDGDAEINKPLRTNSSTKKPNADTKQLTFSI